MRTVGFKVKCNRFILVSDKISGDCLLKEGTEGQKTRACSLDETCRMPERIRKIITEEFSS